MPDVCDGADPAADCGDRWLDDVRHTADSNSKCNTDSTKVLPMCPHHKQLTGTLPGFERYLSTVPAKLDGCDGQSVLKGFTRRLRSVPPSLRKTLTYVQGSEMALHQTLAKRLNLQIFFCDPRSPWQRASNENANGLIPEYLPKGTDLSHVTPVRLKSIETALNNRPRKILELQTPEEVFPDLRLNEFIGVALQA